MKITMNFPASQILVAISLQALILHKSIIEHDSLVLGESCVLSLELIFKQISYFSFPN